MSRTTIASLFSSALALLLFAAPAMALDDNYDPKTDPDNPLKYVANQTYAGIALGEYLSSEPPRYRG